jgi:ArsR family transcriptional regulator, virulence genes transcriptional regulator
MKYDLRELANGYAMLSDRTRLSILQLLAKGPRNVTALCKAVGKRQPVVSHHLGLLRMNGMVIGTRKSKQVIYETDKAALKTLADGLKTLV